MQRHEMSRRVESQTQGIQYRSCLHCLHCGSLPMLFAEGVQASTAVLNEMISGTRDIAKLYRLAAASICVSLIRLSVSIFASLHRTPMKWAPAGVLIFVASGQVTQSSYGRSGDAVQGHRTPPVPIRHHQSSSGHHQSASEHL